MPEEQAVPKRRSPGSRRQPILRGSNGVATHKATIRWNFINSQDVLTHASGIAHYTAPLEAKYDTPVWFFGPYGEVVRYPSYHLWGL
jgi:hypothetical protein